MLSALNESGQPVDFAFLYKVPVLHKGAGEDAATGYEYAYYDPTMSAPDKSSLVINEGGGALNHTLLSLFGNPSETTGWILYNDEFPEEVGQKDNDEFGHTKGVMGYDTSDGSAVWILHSWPKYPHPETYLTKYPTPIYGQTFLILSLKLDALEQIASQMINHQEPQTYCCRLPDSLAAGSSLRTLAGTRTPNDPADSNVLELQTTGGMPIKVIAKNRRWDKDYWNDLVGPALGVSLDVETWIRGPIAPVADSDGIHKVFDCKFIDLGTLGAHWAWPETSDHSKYAYSSVDSGQPWICVADINRMVSQRNRGGGGVAFQCRPLWEALSRTSLVLAPPGMSRAQTHDHIKASHGS